MVTDRSEVTLIERQNIVRAVSLGQDHDGGIGDSEAKGRIFVQDPCCAPDVVRVERIELVDTFRDLLKESPRSQCTHAGRQQVIELGKHEWRQQSRGAGIPKGRRC